MPRHHYYFHHAYGLTPEQLILAAATLMVLSTVAFPQIALTLLLPFRILGRMLWSLMRRGGTGIQIGSERISDQSRLRHTHLVGATGSGKSVLLEKLIYQDLAQGRGALIIDPKGDRDFYERIKAFCHVIGRGSDLHLLSATHLEETVRWNPCRLGSASELQTKFYNSSTYEHSFYAKACELALLTCFNSLEKEKKAGFSLTDLHDKLKSLCEGSQKEYLQGLFFDLGNLLESEWGTLLCANNRFPTRKEISLLDVTRKNEILFVDLPTEAKAVQSARLGRLILQEALLISGLRKSFPHLQGKHPFSIYVDEFDAFATESFATFLNKGRSSGFMIHLAHQTLSDLEKVGESFAGQIMGNCNVRFIFRQDDPNDAEEWSRFFGTRKVVKKTYQTQDGSQTGAASNREVQEFKVSPDRIKELNVGRCIFSMKTPSVLKELQIPKPETGLPKGYKGPIQREETRFSSTKPSGFESVAQRFQGIERAKSAPLIKPKSVPAKEKAAPTSTPGIE